MKRPKGGKMASETGKTKVSSGQFVCMLCKLDYPTSRQFEEHLWSMLHHKAINDNKPGSKHHCNLCMFETQDYNDYAKHLIGKRHKGSLIERKNKLGELKRHEDSPVRSKKRGANTSTRSTLSKLKTTPSKTKTVSTNSKAAPSNLKTPLAKSNITSSVTKTGVHQAFQPSRNSALLTVPNESRQRHNFHQRQPDKEGCAPRHVSRFSPEHPLNRFQEPYHSRLRNPKFKRVPFDRQARNNLFPWHFGPPRHPRPYPLQHPHHHDHLPPGRDEMGWSRWQSEPYSEMWNKDSYSVPNNQLGTSFERQRPTRWEQNSPQQFNCEVPNMHQNTGQTPSRFDSRAFPTHNWHSYQSPTELQHLQNVRHCNFQRQGGTFDNDWRNHPNSAQGRQNDSNQDLRQHSGHWNQAEHSEQNDTKKYQQQQDEQCFLPAKQTDSCSNKEMTFNPKIHSRALGLAGETDIKDGNGRVCPSPSLKRVRETDTGNKCGNGSYLTRKALRKQSWLERQKLRRRAVSKSKDLNHGGKTHHSLTTQQKTSRPGKLDSCGRKNDKNEGMEQSNGEPSTGNCKTERLFTPQKTCKHGGNSSNSEKILQPRDSSPGQNEVSTSKTSPGRSEEEIQGINEAGIFSPRMKNKRKKAKMGSPQTENIVKKRKKMKENRTLKVKLVRMSSEYDQCSVSNHQDAKQNPCGETAHSMKASSNLDIGSEVSTNVGFVGNGTLPGECERKKSIRNQGLEESSVSTSVSLTDSHDLRGNEHQHLQSASAFKTLKNAEEIKTCSSPERECAELQKRNHNSSKSSPKLCSHNESTRNASKDSEPCEIQDTLPSLHSPPPVSRTQVSHVSTTASSLSSGFSGKLEGNSVCSSREDGSMNRSNLSIDSVLLTSLSEKQEGSSTTIARQDGFKLFSDSVLSVSTLSRKSEDRALSASTVCKSGMSKGNMKSSTGQDSSNSSLGSMLASRQQRSLPRPNLTSARSRLRTDIDVGCLSGKEKCKVSERVKDLLSDVARPVWQQKKLSMLLKMAKKSTDKRQRFSHLLSPTHEGDSDSYPDLDIMDLDSEALEELLNSCQMDFAEEDILSQLTAVETSTVPPERLSDTPGSSSNKIEEISTSLTAFVKQEPQIDYEHDDEVIPQTNSRHEIISATGSDSPLTAQVSPSTKTKEALATSKSRIVKDEPMGKDEMMVRSDSCEEVPGKTFDSSSSLHISDSSRNEEGKELSKQVNQKVKQKTKPVRTSPSFIKVYKERHLDHHHNPQFDEASDNVISQDTASQKQLFARTASGKASVGQAQTGTSETAHGLAKGYLQVYGDISVSDSSLLSFNIGAESTASAAALNVHSQSYSQASYAESGSRPSANLAESSARKRGKKKKDKKKASRGESKSIILERVHRKHVKSMSKIKKKKKHKTDKLRATEGEMSSLLKITLKENKLQIKMDRLTQRINKVVTSIQLQEARLHTLKQEKDMVISDLSHLRKERLNVLLGLQWPGKQNNPRLSSERILGEAEIAGIPSSSSCPADSTSSCRSKINEAQNIVSYQQTEMDTPEDGIRISNVISMPEPIVNRPEVFRISLNGNDEDASTSSNKHRELCVPQNISREMLVKTLEEINRDGQVQVDIFEIVPPCAENSTDGGSGELSQFVQPYIGGHSDENTGAQGQIVRVKTEHSDPEYELDGRGSGILGADLRSHKLKDEEGSAEEPEGSVSTKQRCIASAGRYIRLKKQLEIKPCEANPNQTSTSQSSSPHLSKSGRSKINSSQEWNTWKSVQTTLKAGEFVSSGGISRSLLKQGASGNSKQSGTTEEQHESRVKPDSKGWVINMHVIHERLYACISDSRLIIFNLKTNMIETEDDLALGEVKHIKMWHDASLSKMVVVASDGSRNLVQFDIQEKTFLQTLVLTDSITCLHISWGNVYVGMAGGNVASINILKSKVSWTFECSPSFPVTSIASALEGGIRVLIVASEDGSLTIRQARDGLLFRDLGGHRAVVTQLQVSDGTVTSLARDNSILMHDLETGHLVRRIGHQTSVSCFTKVGCILAVAGHSGNMYYYHTNKTEFDIFDTGCANIKSLTASQDMLFLGMKNGIIDVIPLYPSVVYSCEWSHCISRFLSVEAMKNHVKHIHLRRDGRQCLWKDCLKSYPHSSTTFKAVEAHVMSHIKELEKA